MALKNSQYDTIMRDYEQKQLYSRNLQAEHLREAYARIPELQSIDDSISGLAIKHVKNELLGNGSEPSSLKSELFSLRQKKVNLLLEHHFPANYLEPTFVCDFCKDTGYIEHRKCSCFKKSTIELLYSQSNLKEILTRENFDTFSLDYYSDHYIDTKTGRSSLSIMSEAHKICTNFVDAFSTKFQNLFFYGDTGVGKTFLSNCIARDLMDLGHSVIYFTAFELFDTLSKSIFKKDYTTGSIHDYIFDCDLLIIDDLGTELVNSFVVSQLFVCLNERLLRKKSTIISTNISLENLAVIYSERIFSRITSNYTMLQLAGDDIRLKKKFMNTED